jgi:2-phosphosulfolactate phosphatase
LFVDTVFSNNFDEGSINADISSSVCAVIDVIRATSTIAALFGSGVRSIIIAPTIELAYNLKDVFPGRLLCGERAGIPPEGFDYGNSPLEFSRIELSGREIILKTTNGTESFLRAECCTGVFSLSALNFRYTMDKILDFTAGKQKDILLLCSGEMGRIAYDDVYMAGMAVKYILSKSAIFDYSDSSMIALSVVLGEKSMKNALEKSSSARALRKIGLQEDIQFCSRLDNYNIAVKAEMIETDAGILPLLKTV